MLIVLIVLLQVSASQYIDGAVESQCLHILLIFLEAAPVTKNNAPSSLLVDQFSRTITYLRLSLTDRCNLRCMYCMPPEEQDRHDQVKTGKFLQHQELLSYEELLRVVRLAVSLGMNKLRLTGGEPLVRRGILEFIQQLFLLDGLNEVRLTTNGVLLAEYAEKLYGAGVRHLNVSLDTLEREKFSRITGKDYFASVWRGLFAAKRLGFRIKVNVVAMRGVNDDEFIDFARLAVEQPFQIRFIEFMPVGEKSTWEKKQFISSEEIKGMISQVGTLEPFVKSHGEGPARMYKLHTHSGKTGAVGFISPISHHFCDQCNRLRLTSEGKLRACLLNDQETDLKLLLRTGASDGEIIASIRQTIIDKPQGHHLLSDVSLRERQSCSGRMSRIGG
jgi:GTP 3',8-cyclase